jgi:hypothetical protein
MKTHLLVCVFTCLISTLSSQILPTKERFNLVEADTLIELSKNTIESHLRYKGYTLKSENCRTTGKTQSYSFQKGGSLAIEGNEVNIIVRHDSVISIGWTLRGAERSILLKEAHQLGYVFTNDSMLKNAYSTRKLFLPSLPDQHIGITTVFMLR